MTVRLEMPKTLASYPSTYAEPQGSGIVPLDPLAPWQASQAIILEVSQRFDILVL